MGALLDGVEFQLQVSLGLGDDIQQFLYDDPTSLYDTAVYSGLELYWTNFGPRFLTAQTTRGRDKWGDRFPPGSMSFSLSDEDGIFNPDRNALQIGGQSFRVLRWVRLVGRESPSAEFTPLWTGRIDTLTEEFTPGGGYVTMRGLASDITTILSRTNPPALPAPEGAGETTDNRVRRILIDKQGIPPAFLSAEVGIHTMQASALGKNYLEECQTAADAEGGAFYASKDLGYVFRNQEWLDDPPIKHLVGALGLPIQLTDVPSLSWDAGRVRNDVQISRVGGTAQRVVSSQSDAIYGARTYRRLDLEMETDAQAFELAQRQVDFYQWDVARFSELELTPTTLAAARQIMELDLGDRLVVQVRTLRGWDYTMDCFVQRVRHQVTANDWSARVVVENFDRSQPGTGGAYSDAFDASYSPA